MNDRAASETPKDELRRLALAPPQITVLPVSPAMLVSPAQDALDFSRRLSPLYDIVRHAKTSTPLSIALVGDAGCGKSSALLWLSSLLREWNTARPADLPGAAARVVWIRPPHDLAAGARQLLAEVLLAVADFATLSVDAFRRLVQEFRPILGAGFVRAAAMEKLEHSAAVGTRGKVDTAWIESLLDEQEVADSPSQPLLQRYVSDFESEVRGALKPNERLVLLLDDLDGLRPERVREILELLQRFLRFEGVITVVAIRRATLEQAASASAQAGDSAGALASVARWFPLQIQLACDASAAQSRGRQLVEELAVDTAWGGLPEQLRGQYVEIATRLQGPVINEVLGALNAAAMQARVAVGAALGGERVELFRKAMQAYWVRSWLTLRHRFGSLPEQKFGHVFLNQWAGCLRDHDGALDTVRRLLESADSGDAEASLPAAMAALLQSVRRSPRAAELKAMLTDGELASLLRVGPELPAPQGMRAVDADELLVREAVARQMHGAAGAMAAPERIESLDLAGLELQSLTAVAAFPNLRELDIHGTLIADLSALQRMTSLQTLNAAATLVSNPTPLGAISSLQALDLSRTVVGDLRPVARCGSLRSLRLSGTPLVDALPIAGLAALEELDLSDTHVSDIRVLAWLKRLKRLNLSGTPLVEVIALSTLPQLEVLELARTQVELVAPISRLATLRALTLFGAPVSDATRLSGLEHLEHLDLGETQVADISWIAGLAKLERLSLARTRISSLAGLEGLAGLRLLDLSGTEVADVSPLGRLRQVTDLDLCRCPVRDLRPLAGCISLQRIVLSEGQIDRSQLEHLCLVLPRLFVEWRR